LQESAGHGPPLFFVFPGNRAKVPAIESDTAASRQRCSAATARALRRARWGGPLRARPLPSASQEVRQPGKNHTEIQWLPDHKARNPKEIATFEVVAVPANEGNLETGAGRRNMAGAGDVPAAT